MRAAYLFLYNLIQFCGYSWIFTNMTARFFSFGKDSFADTFYAIGLAMRICQLLSVLELLHIFVGIEQSYLLPRFLQIANRIIVLFAVISTREEVQCKYTVWAIFYLWNMIDVLRYPYNMLLIMQTQHHILTWLNHSIWMPLYPLATLAEVVAIYQSLPYFKATDRYSVSLPSPFLTSIHFTHLLQMYMITILIGTCYICNHLFRERSKHLKVCKVKVKRK
ncbi:very-long-chain (3R)-3-hydroxyacyl-CoA dehydratase 4 [Latimeria chalumnae]|uniref:very-long-chain (3R)-3-hydroxyacyl-CoA dehydratase 4 n=1 Tax=Latimeria chalumnae TaxID=7897 RepID=UPI00313E723E